MMTRRQKKLVLRKHCQMLARKASEAFENGDGERGRFMYDRMARLHCTNPVTLSALGRARKLTRRSHKRSRSRR